MVAAGAGLLRVRRPLERFYRGFYDLMPFGRRVPVELPSAAVPVMLMAFGVLGVLAGVAGLTTSR